MLELGQLLLVFSFLLNNCLVADLVMASSDCLALRASGSTRLRLLEGPEPLICLLS